MELVHLLSKLRNTMESKYSSLQVTSLALLWSKFLYLKFVCKVLFVIRERGKISCLQGSWCGCLHQLQE